LFPSNLGVLISIPTVLGYKAMIKNDLAKPNIAAQRDFPMLLELLAGLVNSGLPLRLALSEVVKIVGGASTKPLAQVLAAIEIGCDDTEAWQQISDDPIWADLAHDLARSSSSGSACAPVLLATAATARQTLASEALVAARAVGVRSSLPLVCCYLPAFLLVGVVPIIGGLVGQYLG
jgi:pilus assembly protein TadC